jgi:D-tyrosyl-tRNA(Tyr) deacylase
MRSVVQRVDRVDVRVGGTRISGIEKGILVFLGIEHGDREGDADYLTEKMINLRIFEDDQGRMNLSLLDTQGEMLKEKVKRVSQGKFQATMLIELVNNGPVTILLDSRKRF